MFLHVIGRNWWCRILPADHLLSVHMEGTPMLVRRIARTARAGE